MMFLMIQRETTSLRSCVTITIHRAVQRQWRASALPRASAMVGNPSTRVERAGQLEAERLDSELLSLLLAHFSSTLRFFHGGIPPAPSPELRLLFRGLLHVATTLQHRPTPGRALHNLRLRRGSTAAPSARYGDEQAPLTALQRAAILAVDVLLPYLWSLLYARALRAAGEADDSERERWREERLPGTWARQLVRGMDAAEVIMRTAGLLNLLTFLKSARFPTLAHRIAGVDMCYADVGATRAVSFEFVNRQLVWSGFAEFLVFLSPVLASSRITRLLWRAIGSVMPRDPGNAIESSSEAAEETISSTEQSCGICSNSTPTMPHLALPCRHRFCYVCIAVAIEKEPSFSCQRCGVAVHAISRATANGCM